MMLTYQDYEKATDKQAFVLQAVEEYKNSEAYQKACLADAYYRRENSAIKTRMTFMEKYGVKNSKVKFFKLRCGFFQKAVKQLAQYLLGNGVSLPAKDKEKLGPYFDRDLQKMGMHALVDGVAWGFWNLERLVVFRATEFCPLFCEVGGDLRLGIRFWQLSKDKPAVFEVYDECGVTTYIKEDKSDVLRLHKKRQPYRQKVQADILGEFVVDTNNTPRIPVFPLYANDLKTSELSDGLKEDVDAYDYIASDLVDGTHQIDGVYWAIKNYGGNNDDIATLLEELQTLKTVMVDSGADADAVPSALEVPYKAKEMALALIEKRMYQECMALDMKALTGGNLTNVAIHVAKTDFDLKADLFEYEVLHFMEQILAVLGIENAVPRFKRRSISNDSETVANISMMLRDGYVDKEWAVQNSPLVADEDTKELLRRVAKKDCDAIKEKDAGQQNGENETKKASEEEAKGAENAVAQNAVKGVALA